VPLGVLAMAASTLVMAPVAGAAGLGAGAGAAVVAGGVAGFGVAGDGAAAAGAWVLGASWVWARRRPVENTVKATRVKSPIKILFRIDTSKK